MMLKNTYSYIIVTITSAVMMVSLITISAMKPLKQNNGFNRKFLSLDVNLLAVSRNKSNVTAISGFTKSRIYFQTTSPDELYSTDFHINGGENLVIDVPNNDLIKSRFDCIVDSPFVYLFAGNWPGVFLTNIKTGNVTGYKFPSALFTRSEAVSHNSVVVRGFDTILKTMDQIFIKGNPGNDSLYREQNISPKQGDMGISTDGLLHYDSVTHYLIYVYFYANRLMAFDTSLHIVYESHTIDTIRSLQTKSGGIAANGQITYTNLEPSLFINMESCVSKGLLFNYSLIKADNETESSTKLNSAIDIYRIKDGKYLGSFNIPKYDGEKIDRFRVFNNFITVIYRRYICIYTFQSNQV